MPNTAGLSLIGYKIDSDQNEEREMKTYQVTRAAGVKSYMTVGYSFGKSTEFLIRETYENLEKIREATVGGWPAVRRFEGLSYCLKDDALEAYEEIVPRDYPNFADKTDANYQELLRGIITTLSDWKN